MAALATSSIVVRYLQPTAPTFSMLGFTAPNSELYYLSTLKPFQVFSGEETVIASLSMLLDRYTSGVLRRQSGMESQSVTEVVTEQSRWRYRADRSFIVDSCRIIHAQDFFSLGAKSLCGLTMMKGMQH